MINYIGRALLLMLVGLLVFSDVSNQAQATDEDGGILFFIPSVISAINNQAPPPTPPAPQCSSRPLDNSANFEEQFYKFSSSKWSANGNIPQLDSYRGSPVCPSLKIGNGYATTNQSWFIAGEMDIYVRIKIEYADIPCIQEPAMIGGTGFQIVNLSGKTVLGIRFLEPACPVKSEVGVDYYLPGRTDHAGESIVWPPYNGQFLRFRIQISSHGYVRWYRDGSLKYISKNPISTGQNVRLRLQGSGKLRLYFDDIRVY